MIKSKIHNTVIRDNVEGNRLIEIPDPVRKIIDASEFQRLRHIRQMGLSHFVFPTSEHSRFSHSLGAYANACALYDHLKTRAAPLGIFTPGMRFDEQLRRDFTIAVLCHDVGHTAFSHVLENMLLPGDLKRHEDNTKRILQSNGELSKAVSEYCDIESVLLLLDKTHPNKALSDLVSSAVDVDRCDYLLRDSAMSGVEYGYYDLRWLNHAMSIQLDSSQRPVLILDGARGIDALRQYLSARRYMYRQVYFHKAIRSVQFLLKAIFARIQDIDHSEREIEIFPHPLRGLASTGEVSDVDFLKTTDVEVIYMVRTLEGLHSDAVLTYLCRLFNSRRFPKCVMDTSKLAEWSSQLRDDGFSEQPVQETIFPDVRLSELRDLIKNLMTKSSLPEEAASYLVGIDLVKYESARPDSLLFNFNKKDFTLDELGELSEGVGSEVSREIDTLLTPFTIKRLFCPSEYQSEVEEFLRRRTSTN